MRQLSDNAALGPGSCTYASFQNLCDKEGIMNSQRIFIMSVIAATLASSMLWAGPKKSPRPPQAQNVLAPRTPQPAKLFVVHDDAIAQRPSYYGFVDVIDPQSMRVERTLEWNYPVRQLAVSPDGKNVFVYSNQACYVGVIRLHDDGSVETTQTNHVCIHGDLAHDADFSPDGRFIYFASDYLTGQVTKIQVDNLAFSGQWSSTIRDTVGVVAHSPTQGVLVFSHGTHTLTWLDSNSMAVLQDITLTGQARLLAFNASGTELYAFVSHPGGTASIDIFNANTRSYTASVTLPFGGTFTHKMRVSSDERMLYIAGFSANSVINWGSDIPDTGIVGVAIDLATRRIAHQSNLPHSPNALVLSPDNRTLYATRYALNGAPGLVLYSAADWSLLGYSDAGFGSANQIFWDASFPAQASAAPSTCAADFNGSGDVSQQDLFDFLAAYHSHDLRADISHDGQLGPQDIFDFLAVYNAGCP